MEDEELQQLTEISQRLGNEPHPRHVDQASLEEYQITEGEMLTLQLLQSKAETAQVQLQLATQAIEVFTHNLAGKYSEYGKYQLHGEIDVRTRTGSRRIKE
jgi:hypothetical protein